MPATLSSKRSVYLAPLTSFYDKAGKAFPEVGFIHGEAMPEPYQYLLVHHSDMTLRLAQFHKSPVSLDVLALDLREPVLSREVILRREDSGKAVEFGAIRIHLDRLPDRVADPVREARRPLGEFLRRRTLLT